MADPDSFLRKYGGELYAPSIQTFVAACLAGDEPEWSTEQLQKLADDNRVYRASVKADPLPPVATNERLSFAVDQFTGSGHWRQTVRDTDLLGYYVPDGTNVVTWPGMNHRLPELWTDPDKFDPDRFSEPRAEHKKHRYAFAPFGGGAHKCIGMMFGQLEIKIIIHRLLRRYRLEPARPGYQPHWDCGGMPVPIDGMPLILKPLR